MHALTIARLKQKAREKTYARLFNDLYVSAFETILAVEKAFGTELRDNALRISRERYTLRQEAMQRGFQSADILATKDREGKTAAGPDEDRATAGKPT